MVAAGVDFDSAASEVEVVAVLDVALAVGIGRVVEDSVVVAVIVGEASLTVGAVLIVNALLYEVE